MFFVAVREFLVSTMHVNFRFDFGGVPFAGSFPDMESITARREAGCDAWCVAFRSILHLLNEMKEVPAGAAPVPAT